MPRLPFGKNKEEKFIQFVAEKNMDQILSLIKNNYHLLETKNTDNMPYLFFIIEFSNVAQFTALIKKSHINISELKDDEKKRNILQYTMLHEINDITLHLIENLDSYNIDVNYKNSEDVTALHYAVLNNHVESINLLLKHPNIDINLQSNTGVTALHDAVIKNHIEPMNLLLNHPTIDINLQSKVGNTPLHNAVIKNHVEPMSLLLNHPTIDINIQDNNGYTALHCAVIKNHVEPMSLLLNYPNIDINIQSNNGSTPLHRAVVENHREAKIVQILLKNKNINLNIKNNNYKTAYDIAVKKNYHEVANLIKVKTEEIYQKQKTPAHIKPKSLVPVCNTSLPSDKSASDIEKEIKELKIKLKLKKREEQLKELQIIQQETQSEIERIGKEIEMLNIAKSVCKRDQAKNEMDEEIKVKEHYYDQLLKKIIDTAEIEKEIKLLKESLNYTTQSSQQNILDKECPICFDEMYNKRIFQCSQGHHYCETCKPKIQICPYCREDLSNKDEIRTRVLEQMLAREILNVTQNK